MLSDNLYPVICPQIFIFTGWFRCFLLSTVTVTTTILSEINYIFFIRVYLLYSTVIKYLDTSASPSDMLMTLGFNKIQGFSWKTKRLSASQDIIYSMKLVYECDCYEVDGWVWYAAGIFRKFLFAVSYLSGGAKESNFFFWQ